MANPQIEDGYIRIARELSKAFQRLPLNKTESQIMWTVLNKTYGWNKTKDEISIGQFCKETGVSRRGICKALVSLVNKKALGSERNGTSFVTSYWIQKDYNKWLPSEQKGTSAEKGTRGSAKTGKKVVPKKAPTIDIITIDNIKNISIEHFESLWLKYPRRLGKKEALRHYRASVLTDKDRADIECALDCYLKTKNVLAGDMQFIKHGSTWFNNWRDFVNYEEPKTEKEKEDELRARMYRRAN